MKELKVGMVAGEASGDALGAKLIEALQKHCPNLQVEGIGGEAMQSAGCRLIGDGDCLNVMGFIEPLFRLPELIRLRRKLYQHFIQNPPDVFIGVDSPDFNLGLESKLRAAGIPTVHYVSPSVWAWRRGRVKKIVKSVDLMLTLFPFEAKFYQEYEQAVCYVGHPLADRIPLHSDKRAARRALGIDEDAKWIALLPGSRQQELKHMAPVFLQAAQLCWLKRPNLRFITVHANAQREKEFYADYKKYAPDLPLTFFTQRAHEVMAAADIVLVGSGTATLETMLYKRPMVIVYRMAALTYQIARFLVHTPYCGLPNLLAEKLLVPELIQDAAQPEVIAEHIFSYLDHPEKVADLEQTFLSLHQALLTSSADRAAQAVLKICN